MSVSLTVSIESLVLIAFDRFVAVVWPMKARLISSRFRVFAISSTWIFAVGLNCLDLYSYRLILENGTISCDEDSTSPAFVAYRYTRVTVAYIGPMILITVLYSNVKSSRMISCQLFCCSAWFEMLS